MELHTARLVVAGLRLWRRRACCPTPTRLCGDAERTRLRSSTTPRRACAPRGPGAGTIHVCNGTKQNKIRRLTKTRRELISGKIFLELAENCGKLLQKLRNIDTKNCHYKWNPHLPVARNFAHVELLDLWKSLKFCKNCLRMHPKSSKQAEKIVHSCGGFCEIRFFVARFMTNSVQRRYDFFAFFSDSLCFCGFFAGDFWQLL